MFHPNPYMQIAIEESLKAFDIGEIPIGAVIVDNKGFVIGRAHNLTEKLNNASMHAEICAINSACASVNSKYLIGTSIYVTLEPCYMCAGAISATKIKNVYIGAQDTKYGAIINGARIYNGNINHRPNIYHGIMENECKDVLNHFFHKIRC